MSGNHQCPVCGHEERCVNTIIEPQAILDAHHNCGMCGSTWKERWKFDDFTTNDPDNPMPDEHLETLEEASRSG